MKKQIIAMVAGMLVLAGISAGTALAAPPKGTKALPLAAQKEASTDVLKDAAYVGSQACGPCHGKEHESIRDSWHANMLRTFDPAIVKADFNNVEIAYKNVEIEGADKQKVKISPTIRLSTEGNDYLLTLIDKDNPANNQTFRIAFVLGGNWNQHFIAQVGAAHYPTPMRWIVEDGQWITKPFNNLWWVADGTPDGRPGKAEEFKANKEADVTCNGCHTTGFTIAKDMESGKWKADVREFGVTCEDCHGPGSRHVAAKTSETIVNPAMLNAVQQDQLCGRCHSRVTNSREQELSYPVGFLPGNTDLRERVRFWNYSSNPKNFWANEFSRKNRQQYHDERFSGHTKAGVTCITCHDVHSARRGDGLLRIGKNDLCIRCHEVSSEMYAGSAMAQKGVGCADCHMARLANRSGATQKIEEHWDVTSHTFAVVMPQKADEQKMRSSCDACHAGADRAGKGSAMAQQQAEITEKIAEVEAAIAASKKGKKAEEAGKLLAVVKDDRSFGAHNPQKAMVLLDKALKIVAK